MDSVLRETAQDCMHILLPRKRVAVDNLLWSIFLFIFFGLVELIIIFGNAPWPVLLMPSPCLLPALMFFHRWHKWFSFGQIVKIDTDSLVITEKIFSLFPRRRRFRRQRIRDFTVVPFVVYKMQMSPALTSPTKKGFCVQVLFQREKLFGFIEKNLPHVTIGGYLTREEAKFLNLWLKERLKNSAESGNE